VKPFFVATRRIEAMTMLGNRRAQDVADEACEFLEGWGATNVRVLKTRRGHPRIVFAFEGIEYFHVLSSTPGDPNAVWSCLRELRHLLGLVATEKRVGKRRARSLHRRRRIFANPPALTVVPDWHPPLLQHPLYPAALKVAADEAWRNFWRACMAGVGMRSRL
jgi:hypothetical protein